ncbi:MAG: NTP transferase domain-containing protein [Nitrospira sp.]|nr:NTP transferase domain-containing protein [Nitrospira sp.]
MALSIPASGGVWAIVLAGGEGSGVTPFVSRWLGRMQPKQYCTFVGVRSMFQHALDRAVRLTPPEHLIAVVAREHRQDAVAQLDRRAVGSLLLQSLPQGSAAGLFLPLTYVRHRDPQATVVVLPSDHFVYPEERFLALARQAASAAERLPDRLVLLGAVPDRLELDYGWIQPGPRLADPWNDRIQTVRALLEHPTIAEADTLLQIGGLWNTRAFTANVETLWALGTQCFPRMMPLFERLGRAIGSPSEARDLKAIYRDMPGDDFFSGLIRQGPDQLAVLALTGVLWSDWGKPERITETLRRIDRSPAFPLNCLDRPFVPIPFLSEQRHAPAQA